MSVRIVLVVLVACLGLELEGDRCRRTPAAPRQATADALPSTALWIRERIARAERALAERSAQVDRPATDAVETGLRVLGVAGTSVAWPAFLSQASAATTVQTPAVVAIATTPIAFESAIEVIETEATHEIASDNAADAIFELVVNELTDEFLAELAAIAPAETTSAEPSIAATQQPSPEPAAPESEQPIVALENADEVPPAEAAVSVDQFDLPAAAEDVVENTNETPVAEASTPATETQAPVAELPIGRLANALRLTGRACAAWADVLDGVAATDVSSNFSEATIVR